MAWSFRARKVLRFGPVFVNLAAGGARGMAPRFSSWGLRFWRWTWNVTNDQHTVDTPGPGHVTTGRRWRRRS